MRSFWGKLLIGVVGLWLLFRYGAIDLTVLMKAASRPDLLAIAFACLLVTVPLAAVRWWLLLRGLAFGVGFRWTVNTTLVSLFFHTFLPGAYGGDIVRIAIAYRLVRSGLNRLTFSVLIDRLTGLIALLMLSFAVVPVLPVAYAEWVGGIAVAALIVGVVGLTILLTAGQKVVGLLARLPGSVGRTLSHICREVLAALHAYLSRPSLLGAAIVISVVQYAFVIAALFVLGMAMNIESLPVSGYIVAGTWSLVANAVPLTPGGLGVGEAAFGQVASLLAGGGEGYSTVFLAMRVLSIGIGMLGVLPWLLSRVDLNSAIAALRRRDMGNRPAQAAE